MIDLSVIFRSFGSDNRILAQLSMSCVRIHQRDQVADYYDYCPRLQFPCFRVPFCWTRSRKSLVRTLPTAGRNRIKLFRFSKNGDWITPLTMSSGPLSAFYRSFCPFYSLYQSRSKCDATTRQISSIPTSTWLQCRCRPFTFYDRPGNTEHTVLGYVR